MRRLQEGHVIAMDVAIGAFEVYVRGIRGDLGPLLPAYRECLADIRAHVAAIAAPMPRVGQVVPGVLATIRAAHDATAHPTTEPADAGKDAER